MIVYVETNFILELAFQQEQHQAVNSILELAERGKIELVYPGFSIRNPVLKLHVRVETEINFTKR